MRDGDGADLIGGRDGAYHAEVARAFDRLAEAEPERFRLVDAAGAPEAVTARLLAALADMLQ